MKKLFLQAPLLVCLLFSFSLNTLAYTYSAAGKEPLIDGREALLQAANNNDFLAASKAYEKVEENVLYFKKEYGIDLDTPMRNALKAKDAAMVSKMLNKIYVAEINRRLTGAEKNINDYQVAKVLVVKSKLFLDLLTPQMPKELRQQANKAIQGALQAVGNPGVFGVGAAPADPDSMKQSHELLMQALQTYQ